jgi:hypothetical protein
VVGQREAALPRARRGREYFSDEGRFVRDDRRGALRRRNVARGEFLRSGVRGASGAGGHDAVADAGPGRQAGERGGESSGARASAGVR